jgi:methylated-DNA-[protein]-cysteine S-methyltransferase
MMSRYSLITVSSHSRAHTAVGIHPSPLGILLLAASQSGLRSLTFCPDSMPCTPDQGSRSDSARARRIIELAVAQLDEYFSGQRMRFELPLDSAGTRFQRETWNAIGTIAPGATLSYQQLASRIERPRAARAVGAACARNPLPVVVPCHRVISANGSPGGYLGGAGRKAWLLHHEVRPAP